MRTNEEEVIDKNGSNMDFDLLCMAFFVVFDDGNDVNMTQKRKYSTL